MVGYKKFESTNGAPIVPLPEPPSKIKKANNFRSTWIVSSLKGLRERGHFDAYQANLVQHRDAILSCIAGTWVPMPAAVEHYEACEKLGLSDSEYDEVTKASAPVRDAWNARLVAELSAPDSTPWTAFSWLHRTWEGRAADGGAFGGYKLSENKGGAIYVGCELWDIPYFSRAVRTMIYLMVSLTGAKDINVQLLPRREPATAEFLVDWK